VIVTTLNANGLRSAQRRGFATWLAAARPDVLCLQEIRCDADSVPPGIDDGWATRYFFAEKKGYAGTAVWARQAGGGAFSAGTGDPRGDAEGRATRLRLPGLDVWSLYMPSGSSGPDRQAWKFAYMEHISPWMDAILHSGVPTLVCGDINIAHTRMDIKNATGNAKNSGFLPEERAWLDRLVGRGWRDLFRELNPELVAYSWWSNRGRAREKDVGWRIDHIWATPGVKARRAWIDRHASLSDHAPVSVELA
jgi:exodeoxyribonuclease-3